MTRYLGMDEFKKYLIVSTTEIVKASNIAHLKTVRILKVKCSKLTSASGLETYVLHMNGWIYNCEPIVKEVNKAS